MKEAALKVLRQLREKEKLKEPRGINERLKKLLVSLVKVLNSRSMTIFAS